MKWRSHEMYTIADFGRGVPGADDGNVSISMLSTAAVERISWLPNFSVTIFFRYLDIPHLMPFRRRTLFAQYLVTHQSKRPSLGVH